jgi:hypothetical protein
LYEHIATAAVRMWVNVAHDNGDADDIDYKMMLVIIIILTINKSKMIQMKMKIITSNFRSTPHLRPIDFCVNGDWQMY